MRISLFKKLHVEGLITDTALEQAEAMESRRLFSLYWELRLLLYLGVLLLTGGLGILVYKHIDTIGHQAVLAFIALVTFLILDLIGSLMWAGMLAGLGYELGHHAVTVAQTVSHYGLWFSLAIIILIVFFQIRNARMNPPSLGAPSYSAGADEQQS